MIKKGCYGLVLLLLILPLSFNACGPGFKLSTDVSESLSSGDGAPPESQPEPHAPEVKTRMITVVASSGGRLSSSADAFTSFLAHEQAYSPLYSAQIFLDPMNPATLQCPVNASVTDLGMRGGYACCFSVDNCIGGTGHSDFLYRGLAYGSGVFVAAGGWLTGITRSTKDGKTWRTRQFHVGKSWIPDVAFGNGRFVITDSRGKLMWSLDGENWIQTTSAVNPYPTGHFRDIFFLGKRFFAVGDNGVWAFTADGTDWQEKGTTGPLITSVTVKDGTAYAIANGEILKINADTGTTWQVIHSELGTKKILTVGNMLYAYGNLKRIESEDGVTWTRRSTNLPASNASFDPNGYFIASSYNNMTRTGTFYRSADGLVWETLPDVKAGEDHSAGNFASGRVSE